MENAKKEKDAEWFEKARARNEVRALEIKLKEPRSQMASQEMELAQEREPREGIVKELEDVERESEFDAARYETDMSILESAKENAERLPKNQRVEFAEHNVSIKASLREIENLAKSRLEKIRDLEKANNLLKSNQTIMESNQKSLKKNNTNLAKKNVELRLLRPKISNLKDENKKLAAEMKETRKFRKEMEQIHLTELDNLRDSLRMDYETKIQLRQQEAESDSQQM